MTKPAAKDRFDELWHELDAVPEGRFAEIVAGQVRVLPRPGLRHARAASKLGASLDGSFGFDAGGPGGWVLLDEPDLRIGDELRSPDLAGWRTERFVAPDGRKPFVVAPDWVCEVLSPSTARFDRVEKMPLYASFGVQHLWLIDPEAQTLEIYRRSSELWLAVASHAASTVIRAEPFDAVELDLGALWRLPGDG
ncbi:MAG: Uma2 family endonuclease [Myxococcota bacterium]